MELKKAARELGLSTSHLYRMIESNTLPAQKKIIVVELKKTVYDIDEETVMRSKNFLQYWTDPELELHRWLGKWIEQNDISLSKLAQMSRIKKRTLQRIIDNKPVRGLSKDYKFTLLSALIRQTLRTKRGGMTLSLSEALEMYRR